MSWRTGCNSMRRNPMTAIVQRPGREVVAFEMRVRLALAVPRGGVGNRNRLGPRPRDARANRARPTPVDPRGMNSGTTNARRRRQTKPPSERMPSWSNPVRMRVCRARGPRSNRGGGVVDRWQKIDALASRASRCRCKSCPIHAAVAQGSERLCRRQEDAGSISACGPMDA